MHAVQPRDRSTELDLKATPTSLFLRDERQIDQLMGANKPKL
ncbi:hypothetical protein HanHA300_Chr03g0082471 [Helianthus annuus]|nr:hypothetical protein HanHA300_Chr03g0082471 [Helianthus annuus]KAJ0607216.1 hypothetical protein HanHA89_Chr03g0093991 [Helianthus annuus]KAJ0767274.1 hypothetical protein HanLR1_Chr03g0087271 [Helianthus annuus]